MMPTTWRTAATLCLLAILAGGCEPLVSKSKYDQINQEWIRAERDNRDLTRQNELLLETIGRQSEQITSLQNLGDKRLDKLFYVTGLELGRRSGGVDRDKVYGDDAVIVYLQPVDRDGHVIKAAGEATVQLFDLARPPAENLIGEYHWSVDDLGPTWAGGFLSSSQFSLLCPWRNGPPAHGEITVRATFTDYLTGKGFTAQRTVSVTLPREMPAPAEPRPSSETAPVTQPASAPAGEPDDAAAATAPAAD